MIKKASLALAGVAVVASLAACGETKLMGSTLPDETRVVDGPGLVVPPDFTLRAPADASEAALRQSARNTANAKALVTGASPTAVTGEATAGPVPDQDRWLLEQTGSAADPMIRDQLDGTAAADEAAAKEETAKKGLIQRWLGR